MVVPEANAKEAAMVSGLDVYPVRSLLDVIHFANSGYGMVPIKADGDWLLRESQQVFVDFKDVRGQQTGPTWKILRTWNPNTLLRLSKTAAWTASIGHKLKVAAARASSCARRTAEGGCPHTSSDAGRAPPVYELAMLVADKKSAGRTPAHYLVLARIYQ